VVLESMREKKLKLKMKTNMDGREWTLARRMLAQQTTMCGKEILPMRRKFFFVVVVEGE